MQRMLIKLAKKKTNMHFCQIKRQKLFVPEKFGNILQAKKQQTKMLVTCQKFVDLFLFGLVWQYSTNKNQYNKGRFEVMATYLQQ